MTDDGSHRGSPRFLLGLGGASFLWFVALAWLATSDTALLLSAGVLVLVVVLLAVRLLPGALGRSEPGASRRLAVSLALWALAFGVFLAAGLLWNRDDTFFWLLTAPLVAGPAFIGAQVEARR
ncbi:MAG: hypothetical protein ACLFS9_07320 [Nitriliruptoraceae bacterium]